MEKLVAILTILGLAFIQNVSFSIVSRSRNRNNVRYHLIAAFFSNTIWFLTFRQLVKADMTFILFLPYCMGTMMGSVFGVKISMFFEKILGAAADGHLKSKFTVDTLAAYWDYRQSDIPRPMAPPLNFRRWLDAGKPKSQLYSDDELCLGCNKNPIAPGRNGSCVDCSH